MMIDSARTISPVLITGSHRSGTTWVGGILGASPKLHYIQEPLHPHNVVAQALWGHNAQLLYTYIGPHNDIEWREAYRKLFAFQPNCVRAISSGISQRVLIRILKEILRAQIAKRQGKRPLLKDPYALLSAPWLNQEMGVRVVVLIRHPCAFVSSINRIKWDHEFDKHFLNRPMIIEKYFSNYIQLMEEARRHDRVWRAALMWRMLHDVIAGFQDNYPEWIYLRHEDICKDPVKSFRWLSQRLGIDFDSRMQSRLHATSDAKYPVNPENQVSQAQRRNSKQLGTAWKQQMDQKMVDTIRQLVEPISSIFYTDSEW